MTSAEPVLPSAYRQPFVAHAVLLLTFVGLGLATVAHHEPWRDESQAWLIARDADLVTLFRLRQYEGRPAVWDLLLLPLAKSGLPIMAAQLLHLTIATTSLLLVLTRAPLPTLLKWTFAFSYYQFWQYAIVMRIYAVAFLWLWCLAVEYPHRYRRPLRFAILVGLLFNTTIHGGFLAAAVTFLFAADVPTTHRRHARFWLALAIMVASALACVWQVWMASEHPHVAGGTFRQPFDYTQVARGVCGAGFAGGRPSVAAFLAGAALLVTTCFAFLSRWQLLLILLVNLCGHLTIYGLIGGHPNHHGFLPLGILFCLWIAPQYQPYLPCRSGWSRTLRYIVGQDTKQWIVPYTLAAAFLASSLNAAQMHVRDWQLDYSGGYRMAMYLRSHSQEHSPIVTFPSSRALSVLAHLPGQRAWFAERQEFATYLIQDALQAQGERLSLTEVVQRAETAFPSATKLSLLLNTPLDSSSADSWEHIFRVDETVFGTDERLYLYRRREASLSASP